MKNALIPVSLIALIVLLLAACDKMDENCPEDYNNGLTFVNHSARYIKCEIYWNYPDTAIGEYNPKNNGNDGLSPGEEFTRGAGRHTCWESILRDGRNEWIYIFDRDSLEVIPWDTIRKTGRGLLERRELNLEELQATDFKVIYK